MVNFDDRVVLVTGAGRGLGFAYARGLAELGARVLIQDAGADPNGHGVNTRVAEDAAASLRSDGLDVLAANGSIASRDDCHGLVRSIVEAHGRLDAVIHNAGWVAYEAIDELREESFDHMMAIGAKSPLWLAQAAWATMRAAGYGRFVITTSDRALYPQYVHDGLASYAAAKIAVVGITNVLASEGAPYGIVVNALSPVAKTRMWGVDGEPGELRPSEVAPGAVFLASAACTEGGWILRASNGQFHATRACEAPDVNYPRDLRAVRAATAGEVASNWPRIAVPTQETRA